MKKSNEHKNELFIKENSKYLSRSQIITGTSEEKLSYHNSCILVNKNISGILKPKNTNQVQSIIKLANKYEVPIYPISRGNNWGYGSKNPVKNNSFIVDLSLMNKIIEFDNTLGYVRLEPGVTQQQLYDFLEKNDAKFQMDPTGSAPSTSVLANALERGFGMGQYNNHFESLANIEIVLPNSSLLQTGFGHYEKNKAKNLYKFGIGPYIDGLFSQSNLGIMTAATLHLAPKHDCIEMMAMKLDDETQLSNIIDSFQKLKMKNICSATINVLSRKRLLTTKTKFPFDKTNHTMMSQTISKQLGVLHDLESWNIVTALYGSKEQVILAKKEIKKEFNWYKKKISFMSEEKLESLYSKKFFLKTLTKSLYNLDLDKLYPTLKKAFSNLKGRPSTISIQTPYFRSSKEYNPNDPNPAEDNCGIYWISPILPFTGKDVEITLKIGERVCSKYGFDFAPTYSLAGPRFIDNTISLIYNKGDLEETKKAHLCNQELILEYKKAGYMIYRAGVTSMDLVADKNDSFWKFKKDIKKALDPKNILAPGRYG
jgi:4-cresol dehydrogenase (hydroxylating)